MKTIDRIGKKSTGYGEGASFWIFLVQEDDPVLEEGDHTMGLSI